MGSLFLFLFYFKRQICHYLEAEVVPVAVQEVA